MRMDRDATGTDGLRVRCPREGCKYEVLEPDWTCAPITDHRCPRGHWLRIEGDDPDDLDTFTFYAIDPTDIHLEYMV